MVLAFLFYFSLVTMVTLTKANLCDWTKNEESETTAAGVSWHVPVVDIVIFMTTTTVIFV